MGQKQKWLRVRNCSPTPNQIQNSQFCIYCLFPMYQQWTSKLNGKALLWPFAIWIKMLKMWQGSLNLTSTVAYIICIWCSTSYLVNSGSTLELATISNINSSLIEAKLWQRFFGYFVCFVLRSLSEGNDNNCDINIAYHVENSLPNKFLMLIWG